MNVYLYVAGPKKMFREEEEIYNILYKKKEINDKIPKLSEPSV